MSSRERFRKTMGYGRPDRVPYFEEGIRKNVLKAWQTQGLAKATDLKTMFPSDHRERMQVDLEPRPKFVSKLDKITNLKKFQRRLDPVDKKRLPRRWPRRVREWQSRDHVLMLYVHRGFFLTMGVRNWRSFADVMVLLMDQPDVVRKRMQIQGEFAARLTDRIMQEVEIDAVVFSEPIGGSDRPLISPQMYEEFVLKIEAMDYRSLRKEFGRELRLIGGIDLDALRENKEAIRREIEEKVPPLIAEGGYIPLADGRVRQDVPFENYIYYRQLLEKVTRK
jgi:hypothetical protein